MCSISGNAAPHAASPEVTIVVVAGPRDGPFAARTASIKRGATQAAAGILSRPGSQGNRHIKIIEIDDGCQTSTAFAAAEQAAALKPALVLGHPCTAAALAAAVIYARQSILFIATATRHPALTMSRAGPTIYRLSGRDDAQGSDTTRHLAQHFPGQRLAVVHDQTQYATRLAADVARGLAASGLPPPAVITIAAGELDYQPSVAKVMDAKPAAVYFAGFPIEAGIFAKELRRQGFNAPIYLSDAASTPELIETFGRDAIGLRTFRARLMPTGKILQAPGLSAQNGGTHKDNTDAVSAEFAVFAWAAATQNTDLTQSLTIIPTDADFARTGINFDSSGDVSWPSFTAVEWSGEAWLNLDNAKEN